LNFFKFINFQINITNILILKNKKILEKKIFNKFLFNILRDKVC